MPKNARAYWKGFLRLSLVSIGIEIYNAVESASSATELSRSGRLPTPTRLDASVGAAATLATLAPLAPRAPSPTVVMMA